MKDGPFTFTEELLLDNYVMGIGRVDGIGRDALYEVCVCELATRRHSIIT